MATIAELNVRIGATFRELDKGLKGAEKSLRMSSANMSRIGSDMTAAISLPLAALGITAVKSAGDIEALTLALKSQLGTAEAAGKELELLTEAAKNPGLGLEQAVRGSVRLQGVAFSAEEARKVLVEMGNAIASTGGSAQELDNVTRQFAQMTSKGRVLQEDVSILSENMPGLAQLMQKAFGTQSVEAIREMGISGKEFVLQITKAAEELPRVESGIKNSIGNAIDSLKQTAAKFGFAINKAFDITGTIEKVTTTALALAEGFANLDTDTQKLIISIAGIALAAGPVLSIFGALTGLGSQVVGVFRTIGGAIGTLINVVASAELAMTRLKLAMGIVGIVVALGVAIYQLSGNFDAAEFAAEKFADAQKEIITQTASEIGMLNKNFDALKDDTKSRFEKGKSVDALLKQYPEYLKGIDLEEASISRLTEIQKKLTGEIMRGVAERQKAMTVNALYEKRAAILLRIQQLSEGDDVSISEAKLINTGDLWEANGNSSIAVIKKLKEQEAELGRQVEVVSGQFDRAFGTMANAIDPVLQKHYDLRDAAEAEREAHQQGITLTKKDTTEREVNADAIERQKERLKTLKDVIDDISNATAKAKLLGDDEDQAKIEALRKGIERLIDVGFKPASEQVQNLKKQLDSLTANPDPVVIDFIGNKGGNPIAPVSSENTGPAALPSADGLAVSFEAALTPAQQMAEIMERLTGGVTDFGTAFDETAKIIEEGGSVAQQAMMAIAGAVQNYADQGGASFKEFGMQALKAGAQVVRSFIMQGVAAAAASALKFLPPPFNLAAAGIAGAAAGVLFNKLLSNIPGFAKGTMDAPGGLALVGEKGPEILNIPKHSQVYTAGQTSKMLSGMGGGGGNVNLNGEFTVRGTDLVLVLERAQQKNNRFR